MNEYKENIENSLGKYLAENIFRNKDEDEVKKLEKEITGCLFKEKDSGGTNNKGE